MSSVESQLSIGGAKERELWKRSKATGTVLVECLTEQWGQGGHGLELGEATLRIDSFPVASHWDLKMVRGPPSLRLFLGSG